MRCAVISNGCCARPSESSTRRCRSITRRNTYHRLRASRHRVSIRRRAAARQGWMALGQGASSGRMIRRSPCARNDARVGEGWRRVLLVASGEIRKPAERSRSRHQLLYLAGMRRALFIAVLAVLLTDASGVSSLVVPETCPIGTSESAPDSGCPAFCVRCTCACCAASVEHSTSADTAVAPVPLRALTLPSSSALPSGSRPDILHVPKILLT